MNSTKVSNLKQTMCTLEDQLGLEYLTHKDGQLSGWYDYEPETGYEKAHIDLRLNGSRDMVTKLNIDDCVIINAKSFFDDLEDLIRFTRQALQRLDPTVPDYTIRSQQDVVTALEEAMMDELINDTDFRWQVVQGDFDMPSERDDLIQMCRDYGILNAMIECGAIKETS